MNFKLTILGSGSALPTSRRYSTAQALNVHERFFLIDCGEGTQLQLRNAKSRLGKLNRIFISHLHGDHVFGLFGLLSTFNLLGRKNDLYIHAPEDLHKTLSFYQNNFAEHLQFKIHLIPLGKGNLNLIFEDKVVEIYSFPLKHRMQAYGFLFREKQKEPNIRKDVIDKYSLSIKDILSIKSGEDFITQDGDRILNSDLTIPPTESRSYAFCSDTAYYERIIPWITGVDLLYHEATFADSELKIAKQTGHSTASQAAMIARKAGVKKLLLGHFSNRYKNLDTLLTEARNIFPQTYIAEDLEVYEIK